MKRGKSTGETCPRKDRRIMDEERRKTRHVKRAGKDGDPSAIDQEGPVSLTADEDRVSSRMR